MSNPLEELLACLEVLGEYVDQTPDDPALYDSEFLTACWQTVELVHLLIREHNEVIALMNAYVEEQREAQNAAKLIVANAQTLRDLGRQGRP